jgi:hypothetical protein
MKMTFYEGEVKNGTKKHGFHLYASLKTRDCFFVS